MYPFPPGLSRTREGVPVPMHERALAPDVASAESARRLWDQTASLLYVLVPFNPSGRFVLRC